MTTILVRSIRSQRQRGRMKKFNFTCELKAHYAHLSFICLTFLWFMRIILSRTSEPAHQHGALLTFPTWLSSPMWKSKWACISHSASAISVQRMEQVSEQVGLVFFYVRFVKEPFKTNVSILSIIYQKSLIKLSRPLDTIYIYIYIIKWLNCGSARL